jgi:hypothetical protein
MGIGPEVVDREITGPGDVTGRADAGKLGIGAPTPLRLGADDVAGAGSAREGCDELAWRLTVGETTGMPDGTRRIPPAAVLGAGVAADAGASAGAGAAARWTRAGRTALAAEVNGRSGTRTDCRETVGIDRMGAAGGAAGTGDGSCATCSMTSGSSANAGVAAAAAGVGRDPRFARRWTGAGIERAPPTSTGRVRATTRPGVASALTSCPSCWTMGGSALEPGSSPTNARGAATSGIEPAVRWIGGRLAQARDGAAGA